MTKDTQPAALSAICKMMTEYRLTVPVVRAELAKQRLAASQQRGGLAPRMAEALEHIEQHREGLTTAALADLMGLEGGCDSAIHQYVIVLRKAGRAFPIREPGKPSQRWFASEALAMAWWKANQLPPKVKPVKAPKVPKVLAKKAGPAALTGYTAGSSKTAPKLPDGPVDYSKAEYTLDTKVRPTARWQMQESAPLVGGFSSTPPGMNPATGKAWGEAA